MVKKKTPLQDVVDAVDADGGLKTTILACADHPEPCEECGEKDCGSAPRFEGTTLNERMLMRESEALTKTIAKMRTSLAQIAKLGGQPGQIAIKAIEESWKK